MHWIVRVAEASDLAGGGEVDVPSRASTSEAWEAVREATGVPDEELAAAIAAWFHLDVADLEAADPLAGKLLPGSLARRINVYPLHVDDRTLAVATANPCDAEAEATGNIAPAAR